MWIRGLTIVFGAPIIGSFLGTLALEFASSGRFTADEFRFALGIGLITLLFTIPGSLLLTIIYRALANTTAGNGAIYLAILLAGAGIGAGCMALFGTEIAIASGGGYGFATALAWVALHALLDKKPNPHPSSTPR